jgi:hypothetical protein
VFGIVYVVLNLLSYNTLGFNYKTQAFGSIFAVLAAYQLMTTIGGILMSAVSLFWFVRGGRRSGEEQPRRQESITDIALFWYYVAAAGAITYALLYLAPIVI